MNKQSYLEKKSTWRDLHKSGLRSEGKIDGLCRGASTFLGYLEQNKNRYFKSKHVSDRTNGTVSVREIGSGITQIKEDLGLEQRQFDDWYWGSPGESSLDAEKIKKCLSEKSDYSFSWD